MQKVTEVANEVAVHTMLEIPPVEDTIPRLWSVRGKVKPDCIRVKLCKCLR